jgi:phage tail protein X
MINLARVLKWLVQTKPANAGEANWQMIAREGWELLLPSP